MPRLSRFQIMQHVKPLIINYFEELSINKRVFSITDIENILNNNRYTWTLPGVTSAIDFLKFLLEKNILKQVNIQLNNSSLNRYIFKDASVYELALSLNKGSYISHYSAVFLQSLTDNEPKNIFINKEQANKSFTNNKDTLEQLNIDRAFSRPMRRTNQIAKIIDYNLNVYLLNGKNTGKIGVTDYQIYNEKTIPITNIERTLIDIAVRPNYAGGVYEVLNAYLAAKGNFSVNKLVAILKKMDFIYPYHQIIGFYMEKAGYKENLLNLLEKMDIKYNFYLTYEMKDKDYSDRWKLFYPKGL